MSGQNIATPAQNCARIETAGGFGWAKTHTQYRAVKTDTTAVSVRALSLVDSRLSLRPARLRRSFSSKDSFIFAFWSPNLKQCIPQAAASKRGFGWEVGRRAAGYTAVEVSR